MKTTVKKLEDSKILLTVEVPAVDVEQLLNEAAKTLSMRVNIPGFRKGSVPRSVLEAKVGAQAIADEFMNGSGLSTLYSRAINDTEHEPIAAPSVDVKNPPQPGKPFIFEATVEIKPDVKLAAGNKIKVNKEKVTVTDEDVTREVEALRDRFAEIKDSDAKAVEKGLFALIDFEGTADGKPLEGGKASDYLLEIGSGSFWAGFEEKIIGAAAGEERLVEVAIPEDYFEKTMAGKPANFKVTVKELKRKVVPPLDEDFAKKVGFETVEGFRKDVRENILRVKESQAQENFNGAVVQAVTDAAEVDVPQTLVEEYTDRMLSSFVRQLEQVQATLADYLASQEIKLEDFRANVAADALKAAKSDLVLEAVAMKENVKVSDAELDTEMERYISSMGDDANFFTSGPDALTNRARLRTAIKRDIIKAKAVEFLVTQADTKAKPAKHVEAANKEDAK